MIIVVAVLAQLTLTIPRTAAATIDGRVDPGEWTAAAQTFNGGSIRVQRSEASVEVLVEGTADGIAHLCVARGDTVDVLHASAALGRARYVRTGDSWTLRSDFRWEVRDTRAGPDSAAARARYRSTNGWTASTVGQNAHMHELAMDVRWFVAGTGVAVALLQPERAALAVWPAGAGGGCDNLPLAMGNAPGTLLLSPAGWAQLDLAVPARP